MKVENQAPLSPDYYRLNEKLISYTNKTIYTEWHETHDVFQRSSQPIYSYYTILNAFTGFDIGCYFPNSKKFHIDEFKDEFSRISAVGDERSFTITTSSKEEFGQTTSNTFVKRVGNSVSFVNLTEQGTAVEFAVEAKGYGDLVDATGRVGYRCGIVCLKYEKESVYLFIAHKKALETKRNECGFVHKLWEVLEPLNIDGVLKKVLYTPERIRKYGIESGYRCLYADNLTSPKSFYLLNTAGVFSFTRLSFASKLSEKYSLHISFSKDNGVDMKFIDQGEEIVVKESTSGRITTDGLSDEPYAQSSKDQKTMHVISPLFCASHDMKVSSTKDLRMVMKRASLYGHESYIEHQEPCKSVKLKFVVPYPVSQH